MARSQTSSKSTSQANSEARAGVVSNRTAGQPIHTPVTRAAHTRFYSGQRQLQENKDMASMPKPPKTSRELQNAVHDEWKRQVRRVSLYIST